MRSITLSELLPLVLFFLFAGMAIGCAISMVAQRNPLYSAVSLVGVFISLACLYVMLSAPFIAAVQVIVYAGAIMVLFLFVIMLLGVDRREALMEPLPGQRPLAVGLGGLLVAQIVYVAWQGVDLVGGRPPTAPPSRASITTRAM